MKNEKFSLTGMTCAACQANITKSVRKLSGVKSVDVSLLSNQMSVAYEESQADTDMIINAVKEIGYGAASLQTMNKGSGDYRSEWQARKKLGEDAREAMKRRLTASGILLIPLMYIAMGQMFFLPLPGFFKGTENVLISAFTQMLITLPIMIINRKFFQSGFKAISKRVPSMDSLIAIGSCAAFLYGIFAIYRIAYGFGHSDIMLVHQYSHDLYFESCAMILTLVTVGKYLEERSKSKTSDALGKLVDLAPKTAVAVRDGKEQTVPAEQLLAGDIVVIKPGDSIPVDGIVTDGYGYVDQSAITGESIPVRKSIGDTVISATINRNGSFRFRASKVGNDTTLAQIIRLVDEAGNSKAPIARLADRISGIFVPVVMSIAAVTACVWLLAGQSFEFSLSCAIAVLVISCPCALGLATPVAIMVGTGKAADYGILVKSAESLENLHSVDTIVLDKTGTITSGHPSVTDIVVLDPETTEREFLSEAASVESGSEHPLALAVTEEAQKQNIPINRGSDFETQPGRGVRTFLNGIGYIAGNYAFMKENGVLGDDEVAVNVQKQVEKFSREGKTALLFAKGGILSGVIAVADVIRESSRAAIDRLRHLGLSVVMLTGDNRIIAEAIRKELNIDEAVSDLSPADKESYVRMLQEKGHRTAMVGDGINDAPVLSRADIGIAIGAGTDIAIESADVVLMKNSLNDVVTAINLSKAVLKNIKMNLFWAFFYNIMGIPVAAGVFYPAFGLRLSPMIGAAAMSLSSLFVVTNALRLRFFKEKRADDDVVAASSIQTTPITDHADKDNEAEYNSDEEGEISMRKIITVEGMMCDHCKMRVQKALADLDGVKEVNVDLENKKAEVFLFKDVEDKVLCDAVTKAGYTPVGYTAEAGKIS